MNEPEIHLKKLGLSESEIIVYMRMVAGAQNARDLMKTTKMKRPTIYYALNSLEKRGLLSKSGKENDSTFVLSPFERLLAIAREKEDEAMSLTEQISELIPSLTSSPTSKIEKPNVSFFEGVDAIKHVVMRGLTIFTIHAHTINCGYSNNLTTCTVKSAIFCR